MRLVVDVGSIEQFRVSITAVSMLFILGQKSLSNRCFKSAATSKSSDLESTMRLHPLVGH